MSRHEHETGVWRARHTLYGQRHVVAGATNVANLEHDTILCERRTLWETFEGTLDCLVPTLLDDALGLTLLWHEAVVQRGRERRARVVKCYCIGSI